LEQLVKEKPQCKRKHKLTAAMRQRLTKDVRCAVIMRSQHEDKVQAVILLQQDIMNGQANASSSYIPPQNFDRVSVPSVLPKQVRFYTYLKILLNTLKWIQIALTSFYGNSSAIGKMPLIPGKSLTMMRI